MANPNFKIDRDGVVHGANNPCEQPKESEIQIAANFLKTCRIGYVTKLGSVQVNAPQSYHLKHAIERISGHYISNGAVILAARRLGLPMKVLKDSPNVLIGVWLK